MAEENWIYSPSGIPYNWLYFPSAYAERFARNSNQISAQLVTKWDDAGDLKFDLMESAEHVPGQTWLKRTTPLLCPESDALYLGEMTKIDSKPDKDTGQQTRDTETGWWTHDRIMYHCSFFNLPYQVKEDDEVRSAGNPEMQRYMTVHPMPVVQNRVVSSQRFIISAGEDDAGVRVNETAAQPEVLTRFLIKQWMWPYAAIPWAAIADRAGKLNNASFTIKGTTYASERLLYEGLGSQPEEYHGPDGQKYVDIVHSVIVHPVNWNKTFFAGVWQYIEIENSSPTKRRYQTASFTEIFNPV